MKTVNRRCESQPAGDLDPNERSTGPRSAWAVPQTSSALAKRAFGRLSDTQAFQEFAGPVIIEARVELGLYHSLFVRGHGAGLSWLEGMRLNRVGHDRWVWEANSIRERMVFQLLLDDQVWARGQNMMVEAGERIEVAPDFDWPEIPRTS